MARVWSEIEALGLNDAERMLVAACKAGEVCVLGFERPEGPDPEREVRAEVLRYLILGGCKHSSSVLIPYWLPDEGDPMTASSPLRTKNTITIFIEEIRRCG